MLVDSSVWVPFLRGDPSAEVDLLVAALKRADPVWIAAPILQEVLQGADTPERFARWDRILGELPILVDHAARSAAREAARLYARCRWAGITPRSTNDCLIAMTAIAAHMPILHRDLDFIAIARVEPRLALLPL
jgi:predicted nucleic acid-binding protein